MKKKNKKQVTAKSANGYYKIQNVPLPPKEPTDYKSAMDRLEPVTEKESPSFLMSPADYKLAAPRASSLKAKGHLYMFRKEQNGVRCWRIK